MTVVSCDFETRSTCDLRKAGVYRYATDQTTDVWCLAFAVDDGEPVVWTPGDGFNEQLWELVENPSVQFRAWNAQFERVIWNAIMVGRYGWPAIALERWHCTAAEARAMALPGSLDDAAQALKTGHQKDADGARLMMRMARPRALAGDGTIKWWNDADRVARLIEYCKQDVRTEQDIAKRLCRLSDTEREIWLLDQAANDRGIRLDRPLIEAALEVADRAMAKYNAELRDVTRGAVETVTRSGDLVTFLQANGCDTDTADKQAVELLLLDETLKPHVRRALEIRQEAAKSSTAKLQAMLACICADDRARGLLQYCGAGRTGRWAGRLVQPQNMPARNKNLPDEFDPEAWLDDIAARDLDALDLYASPLDIISMTLRSMLMSSDGHELHVADFNAIEARVLAWLAGCAWRLEVFRTHGKIYEASASTMFNVPFESITKKNPLRQKGKVAELALGYQGGPNALVTMGALDMGLTSEELPEIVQKWRAASPEIPALWRELNEAALEAMRKPGTVCDAASGRIKFKRTLGYLRMTLPSGRQLFYAQPMLAEKQTPWGSTQEVVRFWGVNSMTRKWQAVDLYGGLATENAVQAIARDLMAHAMLTAAKGGFIPLLTVHDELVAEAPAGTRRASELEHLMCQAPKWATGLPLAAEGYTSIRYKK